MWTFFYVSDSVLLTAHFLCDVSASSFVALPHFFYIVASLQRLSDSSFAHLYIQEALQRLIKFAVFSFNFLMEGIEPPDVSPIWLWGWEVTAHPCMALIFSGDCSAHTLLWQGEFHCPLLSLKRGRSGQTEGMPFAICSPWFPGLSSWSLPSVPATLMRFLLQ